MKKGFTLLEILVAIGIMSIALILIVTIFMRTLQGSNKSQIIQAFKQNGQSVLENIDKKIRGADRVVCPQTTGSTLVVVKEGLYTKYSFFPETGNNNGYIQTESFNAPSTPPAGSDPVSYLRTFESTICTSLMTSPQTITDTNAQSGVSIYNGSFERQVISGYKDQVVIKFMIRPGKLAPASVTGQIDPASFQTTIQLR